ncbi:MAG TPA: ATP-binding domain-containing protein [Acidimicrobiales bacterium]|nr:ATP-binding domain-containing protein [Acidimicrobiales bacterium]
MTHPDVPAEQAHVDLAYERLAAMRANTAAMLQDAFGERGGTFQAVTERDIRVRNSLGRLEQLDIGETSLVFGRIDRDGAAGDESFHIGRLAISDRDQEPLVVDWRAPVAEPFYRATGAHPMGLARRRHLLTQGRTVLDLEDELFDREGSDSGVGLGLSGPQVLTAALERSRTGRMQDIVSTIQREQDEIIRGPLAGILVVQGGPGTGKTAVALHRAAYLLYTHRFPLEGQGVLVVGPNPTFLRYIEHVLPSLDENGVELTTVSGLYATARPAAREPDDVARIKGDARMARVLAKAVSDRERPLRDVVEVPYGSRVLRITPRASAHLVAGARRRPGTHNSRRRAFENLMWRHLLDQAGEALDRADRGLSAEDIGMAGESLTAEELGRTLRREPAMVEALDRMWPLLTPEQLLHDLFGARPLIDLAATGTLSEDERRLLWRDRGRTGEPVSWTEADMALLDEALSLLGPRRRRRSPNAADAVRTYGHVVVDEAQDLSPMQLRMIGRRSLSGSMTVVGDIAQATGTWAPATWSQVVEHLPARRGWRLVELTVNYRTPAEIMELAGRVLAQVAPGMRPPEAVRATGRPPRIVRAAPPAGLDGANLVSTAATVVAEESAAVSAGTVGVLAPASIISGLEDTLAKMGVRVGRVGRGALDEPVTLLPIEDAKGLEFDAVVVVEPERIARETPQGYRGLYVALTRATQRLALVHSAPLPAAMTSAQSTSA